MAFVPGISMVWTGAAVCFVPERLRSVDEHRGADFLAGPAFVLWTRSVPALDLQVRMSGDGTQSRPVPCVFHRTGDPRATLSAPIRVAAHRLKFALVSGHHHKADCEWRGIHLDAIARPKIGR